MKLHFKIRNPKSEIRKKPEARSPKSKLVDWRKVSPSLFQDAGQIISEFETRPSFGFRISNFGFGAAARRAFTLLEVMIAIAIFFVASFAILGLISTSLGNVRRLQRPSVDASPVLARYAATNSLIEGTYQGSLGDPEMLGKDYRDYNWVANIVEVASNHLYSVECVITPSNGRRDPISDMTTVLYRPLSPPGSLDGGIGLTGR